MKFGTQRKRSNSSTWTPIVSGAISGSILSFVGHPFDTVKVRTQVSHNFHISTSQCVRSIAHREGLKAFYRGFIPAVSSAVFTSALRFGLQSNVNSHINCIFDETLFEID